MYSLVEIAFTYNQADNTCFPEVLCSKSYTLIVTFKGKSQTWNLACMIGKHQLGGYTVRQQLLLSGAIIDLMIYRNMLYKIMQCHNIVLELSHKKITTEHTCTY